MSMSAPVEIPPKHHSVNKTPSSSPGTQHLIPSPIPTRRNRTYSQTLHAQKAQEFGGTVRSFCREKGHGFINPKDGQDPIFVHISDIEGEFVPLPGDEVRYRTVMCPPKRDRLQAVHVRLVNLKDHHERWDSPSPRTPRTPTTPTS